MPMQILSAKPGRIPIRANGRRGKFIPMKANKRRNISQGFHDAKGVFHPIRAATDYDPGRAGEGSRKKAKAKKAPAKKKAAAKKTAKRPAKKKAAASKGGKKR
jgi:hypothetical protein